MNQDERNRREWEDPESWRAGSFYFGEEDSRVIVRKRGRRLGWTFNLAHPAGRFLFIALITVALASVVLAAAWRNG